MPSPSMRMRKLALVFGSISAGWAWWLQSLKTNAITTPYPNWWYLYNIFSLGGWSAFIIYYTMINSNREKTPGPKPHELWNFLHIVPMLLLNATITKSLSVKDKGLLWFAALMVYRYYRTILTVYFYFRYEIALEPSPQDPESKPSDCTVIVPTVGPAMNSVFEDMVAAILWNKPKQLLFSANKPESQADIETEVRKIVAAFRNGDTTYQKEHKLGPPGWHLETVTKIGYTFINDSNKRKQTMKAIKLVETKITIMVDDTAIWHPKFLNATLPAFIDKDVGLVGTRKVVKYIRPNRDANVSLMQHYSAWYWAGLWNTIGALYLQRHNYEIRTSNAADGGVFTVSGRTLLILTGIVQDDHFEDKFLNEYVLKCIFTWLTRLVKWHVPFADQLLAYFKGNGLSENGFGPLLADDDNFITRWVIDHGKSIKIQSSPETTITTVLGNVENFKFLDQCKRWSRTTFRQNPIALFSDRTIWWKWPISVWTVYFPWMYNFAAVWDSLAIITFRRSGLYLDSPNGNMRLFFLVSFIWLTKLIKTFPWFLEHPYDFLLYFCPIPTYPLFGYFHSYVKARTMVTCWNNEWSGRNLEKVEAVAGIVSERKKADDVAEL
ncbi:uncharacterized protein ALTATR162_LOCUS9030 [Alternaria atra]|uniref:Glycosyltransferase family 2 protein n=1 Tax=Alternaria atra TaxID=119953 RepID=A0A8J2N9F6_9PLEO|nr:uncharacterized protein ALTATR162_LOCUS9030 [Alternaria atra]CAG5179094.1 unnamed protein product [Alternaria atra]